MAAQFHLEAVDAGHSDVIYVGNPAATRNCYGYRKSITPTSVPDPATG